MSFHETTPALLIYPSGREVCRNNKAGKEEYAWRRYVAWRDQRECCAICHKRIRFADATSDHITPRGMGGSTRDDRQANIQAACYKCNSEKGSKRIKHAGRA
jgi:5-methylcytosine-specific restriction endonuclease McrA